MNAEQLKIYKSAAQKSGHVVRVDAGRLLEMIALAEQSLAAAAHQAQAEPQPVAEQDEREAFETWASDPVRSEKLPLDRWPTNDGYKDTRTYIAFYGWLSRAELAKKGGTP